ncbi:MAG TPA: phosphate signaling complex protein PhoU [Thermoplasmata archaeon]|nr:phosphate signaling complex protein PhoU [Thermoplasmata archaeon]
MSGQSPETRSLIPVDHQREIRRLEHHLREMTDLAVGMVADGTRALLNGDAALSRSVVSRDAPLDRYDLNIEIEAIHLVAIMQPEGPDLRTIEAILKIATCVDRIGRLGYDIARYVSTAPLASDEATQLLRQMDERSRAMVEQSMGALLAGDADRAKAVFVLDDDVDALHKQTQRKLIEQLSQGGPSTERLAFFLLAARHLERVADNACKIAEKTVYALTGERRPEYFPALVHRPPPGTS